MEKVGGESLLVKRKIIIRQVLKFGIWSKSTRKGRRKEGQGQGMARAADWGYGPTVLSRDRPFRNRTPIDVLFFILFCFELMYVHVK